MRGSYEVVSGIVFGLVAIAQAVRAFNQWPLQVGQFQIPVGVSWVVCAISAALCTWAFQSREK
jgi:hypothetical protein